MRRISIIILLLCAIVSTASAQHIVRNYHDRSMSDVLIDLSKASARYRISFIYNELEDFTITQNVNTSNVPDAIRKVISYYPMKMTVGDSLITVECTRRSDRKLIGRLIDNHNLPVEFANIQLLNPQDSSFLCGGVSNANGDFVIPCQQRQAIMKVSFVGYKTISKLVNIARIGNVQMQADSYALKGVMVKAARKIEKVDRQIVFPTKEQVKAATNGYDLLDNMSLPTILVDKVNRKVTSLKGGGVQVRINDTKATMQDILALQPDEVTKVEFINMPGVRYGDASLDAVINYQVRRRYAGYVGGVSSRQGIQNGQNDTDGYFKYNVKKSEFSVSYDFSYRSDKRSNQSLGTYHLPSGETITRNYLGYDSPFLYTMNEVQLGYRLCEPDRYTLDVRFNFSNYNSPVRGTNQLYQEDGKAEQYLQNNVKNLEQTPSIDLYYSQNMSHNQNLAFNLVGTYISTNYKYRMREYLFNQSPEQSITGSPLSDYSYDATGKKRSLICEGVYTKDWKNISLSGGGQYNVSHTDNSYVGSCNVDAELRYDNLYLFAQLQGKVKWLGYQMGVGATRSSIHQDKDGYARWMFRPQLVLQARASEHLNFRWSSGISSTVPSLAGLSEVRQYINSFEASDGNRNLKPYQSYKNALSATWNVLFAELYVEGSWTYVDKPIASTIMPELREDGSYLFVNKPENQKSHSFQRLLALPTFHIVKNHLDVSLYGEYNNTRTRGMDYQHRFDFWRWGGSAKWMQGNWNVDASYYKAPENYWGERMNGGETHSQFCFSYRYKAWCFGASVIYLFTPHGSSFADKKYNRYVQQDNLICFKGQANMILLSASFNFHHGRNYDAGRRKLNNSDRDNGIR